MVIVDVKKLVEAIEEADAFDMPFMTQRSEYLYENLYLRLAREETVSLSEINFGSFELEDLDILHELHTNVLDVNESKADMLVRSLQALASAATAAVYV